MSARRRLRGLQRLRRDDRGAVAVVVSVLMVVFIGLSAFTIDYGYAYAQRRALSSTADGAALAAAEEFRRALTPRQSVALTPGQTCEDLRAANESAATAAADLVKTANGPASSTLAVGYSCDGGYLMVTATMTKSTNAFFGGIYGKDSYDVWRTAKAVVAPAGSVTGTFLPFGLCEWDARSVIAGLTPGSDANSAAVKVNLKRTDATFCGIRLDGETFDGSGNESRVQLDSTQSNLLTAMTNPGNTKLSIDRKGDVICPIDPPFAPPYAGWCGSYGSVGNVGSPTRAEIARLPGRTFMFPVFNKAAFSGQTRYRLSGFISAKLCGLKFHNRVYIDSGCYDTSALNKLEGTDGDALQLRAARYVPPAELASCPPLGSTATGTPCSLDTYGTNYEFVPVIAKLFG